MTRSDTLRSRHNKVDTKWPLKRSLHWLWKKLYLLNITKQHVEQSLQWRVIVTVVGLSILVALGFASVSLIAVRTTLQTQAQTQVSNDFTSAVRTAQSILDSSQTSNSTSKQQLVSSLATTLQNSGANNLLAVHIDDTFTRSLAPVSTDPSYDTLISKDLQNKLDHCTTQCLLYQPVNTGDQRREIPGAVLASVITMPDGMRLQLYGLYSFDAQQRSVLQLQRGLLLACLAMAIIVAMLSWRFLASIIHPVTQIATAARTLAQGDLHARAQHDRNDEIGVLQTSFNNMADSLSTTIEQLEQLSAMQQRFVSDVSHELRTPVTTIRMAADLLVLQKQQFDPTTRRTVELLDEQTTRFQDMLADLLEISRYDVGSNQLEGSSIEIRAAVEQAVRDVEPLAQVKGVSIQSAIPQAPIMAIADGPRLTRIVRNLLANAVDFAGEKPISLALASNNWGYSIAVCDYGVGIQPDDLRHIFDRFWRADTSRSRLTGGTGLGLAIAQLDARMHHGDIMVRSEYGTGTCFIVSIPLSGESDQSDIVHNAPICFMPHGIGFTIRSGDSDDKA